MSKMQIIQSGITTTYYSEKDIKEAIIKAINSNHVTTEDGKSVRIMEIIAEYLGSVELMTTVRESVKNK